MDGSRLLSVVRMKCRSKILSRDFIITEVSAMGRKSLWSFEHGILGKGLTCEVFHDSGTLCVSTEA